MYGSWWEDRSLFLRTKNAPVYKTPNAQFSGKQKICLPKAALFLPKNVCLAAATAAEMAVYNQVARLMPGWTITVMAVATDLHRTSPELYTHVNALIHDVILSQPPDSVNSYSNVLLYQLNSGFVLNFYSSCDRIS